MGQQPAHPFAQYPYQWRAGAQPGYVGPGWAAPGPRRRTPPPRQRSGRSTCGCIALAGLVLVAVAVVGVVAIALLVAMASPTDRPQTKDETSPPSGKRETDRPTPPRKASELWTYGTCRELRTERDLAVYEAARNSGSARRLRGRIAMLHFRLNPPGQRWSSSSVAKIDQAALAAQRFYLAQAKRYGIADVDVDLVPWPLNTPVQLPPLRPNHANLLDYDTQQLIRKASRRAIETALSKPLEAVVHSYREQGYDEVGLIVYFPIRTSARPFAWFALAGYPRDYADVGYIFAERPDLSVIAPTVAHEGLHLFGARDLYRMQPNDQRDKNDIMNDFCTGFRTATIGETTAFAIGWRSASPPRQYRIVDR